MNDGPSRPAGAASQRSGGRKIQTPYEFYRLEGEARLKADRPSGSLPRREAEETEP